MTLLRALFAWWRRPATQWKSPSQAWRAAPADHLVRWDRHFDHKGGYRFKSRALRRIAAAGLGLAMTTSGIQSQAFTSSAFWTVPSNATGGFVTVTVVGGSAQTATGATVVANVPCSPGDSIAVTVATPPSGPFGGVGRTNGGAGYAGGGYGGAGSSGVGVNPGPSFPGVGDKVVAGGAGGDSSDGSAVPGGNGGTPNGTAGPGGGGQGGFSGFGFTNGGAAVGVNCGGGGGGAGGGAAGTVNAFGVPTGGGGGASWASSDCSNVSYSIGSRTASVTITYSVQTAPLSPVITSNPSPSGGSTPPPPTPPGDPTLAGQGAYLDTWAAGAIFVGTYQPDTDSAPLAKVALRLSVDGGAYGFWNGTNFTSTTAQYVVPTTGAGATAGEQFTIQIPAGILADGHTDAWNVSVQDADGLNSGWAASDVVFYTVARPTVTVTGPTGTDLGLTPVGQWTVVLGSGLSMTNWRAVVYEASQVLQPGFDPGYTDGVFDTGVTSGAATAVALTGLSNLVNYVLYVQVTETGGIPSAWAFGPAFSLLLPEPNAPAVVVSQTTDPVTGNPCNQINVVENDNVLTAADADFEVNGTGTVGSWTATNGTLTTETGWAERGTHGLKIKSNAAGSVISHSNERNPCQPGQIIAAMAVCRDAATAEAITLKVHYYDASNVFISDQAVDTETDTTVGKQLGGLTPSGAPSNAETFDIGIHFTAAGANEEHDVDEVAGYLNGLPAVPTQGGFVGISTIEVQYSDDGLNWADVRYLESLVPTAQQAFGFDFEAPLNKARQYRARVLAEIMLQPYAGPWSAVQEGTIVSNDWWMSIPDYLDRALAAGFLWATKLVRMPPVNVATTSGNGVPSLEVDQPEAQGIFWPLGRSTAVVVRDGRKAPCPPSLTLQFLDDASFQAFDGIVDQECTVLLRSISGICYYVSIGGEYDPVIFQTSDEATNPMRQLTISLSPQDVP